MIVYLMTINASNCCLTFFAQFSQIDSLLQVFNLNVFHITNFTVTSLIHCFLLDLIIPSIYLFYLRSWLLRTFLHSTASSCTVAGSPQILKLWNLCEVTAFCFFWYLDVF